MVGVAPAADGAIALSFCLIAIAVLGTVQRRQDLPFRLLIGLVGVLLLTTGCIYGLALYGLDLGEPPALMLGLESLKLVTAFIALLTACLTVFKVIPLWSHRSPTQNHAQQELQAREQEFRAVFEQAAVGMARLTPDGHWVQVNQKLCNLFGYTPEELQQRTFQEITYPDDAELDQQYYQQLLTGEIESCSFEKRYVHESGDPIWTLVTASKEYTWDGKIAFFIAVIEDIRDRKHTEQQLQQRAKELSDLNVILAQTAALLEKRNSELDQFAYVASHDLKAPLRAIANLSEWIEEDLSSQFELPEENQHQLSLLRGRVHRMEALINGLLEYSRVGRQNLPLEPVKVEPLIMDIVDSLALPSGFQVSMVTEMPVLQTHRMALHQVFSNLINNAVKHHHKTEGSIWIRCGDRPKHYEFSVSDDGPGIDPKYHKKIFTIFQTLKSRDEMESTGIGLAVVKKIVEVEGGKITLESTPGEGSTFRFTWPKL